MADQEQSYAKHGKTVPLYHGVLFAILVLTFIGSLVNLFQSFGDHSRLYNAALIPALAIAGLIQFIFSRIFPLKAQDRAIRAEEGLRYLALTGKRMDPKLTMKQVIGLRFAPDNEFVDLAKKAVDENLSMDAIKKSIRNWRPDHDRL
jgi:L-cystine uptake protein TcyP (sodium:dicarboxylate symporter family)